MADDLAAFVENTVEAIANAKRMAED